MSPPAESLCSRCRSRIWDAGPQRLCSACVSELMKSDHREPARAFAPGDRVQIIQGVFAGQTAVVISVEEDGVVRARSMIMNIPLEVEYLPWQLLKDFRRI
ncbi:MAG: KOW motif-containing protein [Planctomycetes bacterium]|nr:KOW motif-containing protein [Planctomycetota bacterium]